MADVNIGSLELQISSNSKDAANGVEALIRSLSKLKEATKGLGLSTVADDIEDVAKATEKASHTNDKTGKSFTDLYHMLKTAANGFIGKWVEKCFREVYAGDCKCAVLLLFANTDTKWFHDWIYHKAEIRFVKGRIKFGGGRVNSPKPSMVVIFRKPGCEK